MSGRAVIIRLVGLGLAAATLSGCGAREPAGSGAAHAPTVAPLTIARGVVEQEGGLTRVSAFRDGVIKQVLVQEGDTVVAGQVLATLDDRQARLALAEAEAEAGERAAEVAVARIKSQEAALAAGRLTRLAGHDAAAGQDAEQAQDAAAVAKAELTQAQQAASAATAHRAAEQLAIDEGVIRATRAGRIVNRSAQEGSAVTAGAPLFLLDDGAPRVIRAEVDESFADAVRPGMRVVINREFDNTAHDPGHVARLSGVIGASGLSDDPSSRPDARVMPVIIALDSPSRFRLGQRVLVRFVP